MMSREKCHGYLWQCRPSREKNRKQCSSKPIVTCICVSSDLIGFTHWGRVTHICVSKLITFGSDNGLSPGRRQAIIWTNAGILWIWPLETKFSEMLIQNHRDSFKKKHWKMSSVKRLSFWLGLSVLTHWGLDKMAYILEKKKKQIRRIW